MLFCAGAVSFLKVRKKENGERGRGNVEVPVFFLPKHCTLLVADMMMVETVPSKGGVYVCQLRYGDEVEMAKITPLVCVGLGCANSSLRCSILTNHSHRESRFEIRMLPTKIIMQLDEESN